MKKVLFTGNDGSYLTEYLLKKCYGFMELLEVVAK